MSAAALDASVVICTLNRPDDIQRCIASLAGQTRRPAQVVVVDAGDLGDVRARLAGACGEAGIDFVYLQDQPSTTRQRNTGARAATGEILFFLDDDVQLADDYLERILAVYEADPDARLAGVNGVPQTSPNVDSGFWTGFQRLFLLAETRRDVGPFMKRSNFPVHTAGLSAPRRCEIMPSTAVSYRAAIFRDHEFDKHLTGYVMAEDLDLAWRVSRSHRLLVTPEARYRHSKSEVSRNDRHETEKRRILFTQYFFRKNMGGSVLCWLARYWALAGMFLRYAYIALRDGDRQWFTGFCAGVRAAARNRLLFPGRFAPGPLQH